MSVIRQQLNHLSTSDLLDQLQEKKEKRDIILLLSAFKDLSSVRQEIRTLENELSNRRVMLQGRSSVLEA